MNAHRIAALLLVAVQSAAMAAMTKSYPYPIAMLCLAILAPLVPRRIALSGRITGALSLAVGAGLLVYAQRFSGQAVYTVWFPTYATAIAFGRFFLFLQALLLIRGAWQTLSPTLTALLPFLGILVMTCVGNVSSVASSVTMFRVLSLLFAVMAAAYFASSLRISAQGRTRAHALRWTLNLGFMGIALSVAVTLSAAVQRYGNELDRLLGIAAGASMPSATAFTARARLDSMTRLRGSGGTKVALRIVSSDPPGYMRGIAYDTYAPPEWRVTTEVDALSPAASPPAALLKMAPSSPWYLLREDGTAPWKPQAVWQSGRQEGALFAPLDTSWLSTEASGVATDPQGIVRAESGFAEYTNALCGQPDSRPLTQEMRGLLTRLPEDIDPRIPALAQQLTQGLTSDREKIAAVLHYFHGYSYSTELRIPAANDPLVYFLFEKPPAHCEFFAAGTTVLLRASGVPARYVVGFLVTGRNELGGYWCARNRDAHAWCEAYDRNHGWTTVDATPPSGRPAPEHSSRLADTWDSMQFHGGRIVKWATVALQHTADRFPDFMRALALRLAAPRWLAGAAAVLALTAICVLWRRRMRRLDAIPRDAFSEYHRLLLQVDRRVGRAGLRRRPDETLEQFCARILASPLPNVTAIVTWYRAYMRARYGAGRIDEELEALRRSLPLDGSE